MLRIRVPRVDFVHPLQRDLGGRDVAHLQAVVHLQGQAEHQQPVQAQRGAVVLQALQAGHRFQPSAAHPVRGRQRAVHAQHRIGDGDALQCIHAVFQQRQHSLGLVVLVQHLAQQRGREVGGVDAGGAAFVGLAQHLAVDALGLRHAAFHGIAQANQGAALQRA
ncbi:hypothetical protein D9M72_534760 [compost metagenome]